MSDKNSRHVPVFCTWSTDPVSFQRTPIRQAVLPLAVSLALAGMSGQSLAQGAQPGATNANANINTTEKLEEVIVTAQKRKELLQKTPIAITAITTRELDVQRIDNLMDLAGKLPSLSIVPFTGNRAAPNLSIRGMGNLDSQTTKDNAFGIYVDGVPVGRGVGLAADVADLERIELLRGPQGTLYGRNTSSGAINFITIKPEKEFSFQQGLTAGSDHLFASKTRLNVPISDTLYTRLAYLRSSNSGWVKNTNSTMPNQINFNEDDKEAARWALRFLASENFTADFSVDHSKVTYGNVFFQRMVGPTAFSGERQESAPTKIGLSPSRTKVGGQNLTLSWAVGDLVLKSITANRDMKNHVHQDYIDSFTQIGDQSQDQQSQEFQAVGTALDKRLEYVAGVFFYRERGNEAMTSQFPAVPLTDSWVVRAESRSTALYGQASWKPPVLEDRLRLTLGLRETYDKRTASKSFVFSSFDPSSNGRTVSGAKTFKKFTPTYTVDYAFTDDINGYAKIANGYRAGGFNTRSTVAGFGNGFDQEDVRSTELGAKADLLDKKLRVNVAAFLNKYSNLQIDQARVPAFFTDTLNAGKATTKGLELELTAHLAQGWTGNFFYTWLDARLDSYIDNPKGIDVAAQRHMPNSPKSQGGLGLRYLGERLSFGRVSASLDYKWQGDFYSGPKTNTHTNGYGVWSGRIQLGDIPFSQGSLRVALWGKNLTDKKYALATSDLTPVSAQFGAPRTLGLDVVYDF